MEGDVPRIPLRNILFATDFSPCSEVILPYAASLARNFDATLFLAHAISPEVISVEPPVVHDLHDVAARQMNDLESSDQLKGVRHNVILCEGDPAEVIAKTVDENQIDLVIVGTHGRTGIKKFVMGSVAEKIFRKLPCPVLAVGPKVCTEARRQARFLHILFATDFGPGSSAALPYAISLAKGHDAILTILHVVTTAPATGAEASTAVLRKELASLVPAEAGLKTVPDAVVVIGDPSDLITREASIRNADLIVLGARRPAALTTHMMDTAYKVIIEAPCPVLTVSAAAHARTIAA